MSCLTHFPSANEPRAQPVATANGPAGPWLISNVSQNQCPLAKRLPTARFRAMPTLRAKRRRSVKTEAMRLVRDLPASSSWDDVMYRIYVRQKIDAGLSDLRAGRVHSHAAVRKEFGM